MRKVNLRNVDPAIDDPDASTWCKLPPPTLSYTLFIFPLAHPTLNRHSPPEVVANFKRRVPPRLPKPRKRDSQESPSIPPPRSAIGMGPVPLTVPPSKIAAVGRSRGFSAPGSFTPLSHGGATGWGSSYPRSALPPLTVPSDPPHISHSGMYAHSSHTLHPITPTDDSPSSTGFNSLSYSNRDMVVPSSQYPYEQNSWGFSTVGHGTSSGHSGSLSSLLNPSSSGFHSRPTPAINTSYASPFSSMPMQGDHSTSSVSPDSRPTTGYSMSSVSSLPYDDNGSSHLHHDYSRPSSSHHRSSSPNRPHSSKSAYSATGSLSVRRSRRHSQAMSPYPSPYDHTEQQRPSTSPQPNDDHQHSGIPRVRSMIQLPSVDPYTFNSSQADFAYSAVPGSATSIDSMDGHGGWNQNRSIRPSTSSSMSAASHTSSSQANTPPVPDNYNNGDTGITRCE